MDSLRTALFGLGTVIALFVLQRLLQHTIRSSGSARTDSLGKNHARALREVGDVLGVLLVSAAVVKNCVKGEDLARDVGLVGAFGGVGLVLLEVTGMLGERLLLGRRIGPALERGNLAAGIAAGSHTVAVSIVISRALAGSDLRGLELSAAFFGLGIVTHQIVVTLFRALTVYDDAEQIDGENTAAAISYGGASISVAIVIARALEGDFEGWRKAILGFSGLAACALGLLVVRQLVVPSLVLGQAPALRGGPLDEAVGRERNVGVAALEAATLVGAALAVAVLA